jgi:uncharacterized membrane protein YhaH (DUF805 family)
MEWYVMAWKKFAQFSGRSRRKEYWMFALFNCLIGIVLYGAGIVLYENTIGKVLLGLYLLYLLAVIVPLLAVSVRRLHDTDKNGWMFLLSLIPLVGPIILVVFFASAGNSGANQYGPDPKSS